MQVTSKSFYIQTTEVIFTLTGDVDVGSWVDCALVLTNRNVSFSSDGQSHLDFI